MNAKQLVMSRLPIQDNKKIQLWVDFEKPVKRGRRKQIGEMVDVTSAVNQLLNEGKLKRVREFKYGHSGRAGHTYLVSSSLKQ